MELFDAKIVQIKDLTHNTKSFLLRLSNDKHFLYQAGQFVTLIAEIAGKDVRRAYSIASPPPRDEKHAEYIELIVKHVPGGAMTSYLFSLKEGSSIRLAGPFGKFILKEPIQEGDIFMATGSGIAPFMAMLRKVFRDHNPKQFYLFFGAKTQEEIIYAEELLTWNRIHDNFHFIPCLSEPVEDWDGETGYVQDKLHDYIKEFKNKQAYLCGIPMMVSQARDRLMKLGMKEENIYRELY